MKAAGKTAVRLRADEFRLLRWGLGAALSVLGAATVLYMEIEAPVLMTLAFAAALATTLFPALPARVPRLVHPLAFPVIVMLFAADLWRGGELLPAVVRLGLLLLIYRNLSYRKRRDDLQVILLGLFLIIVAGVLTVSLTFAAHLLVYAAVALALLLVITLGEAAEAAAPSEPVGETPAWARSADWGALRRRLSAVADWRAVGLGAALFAGLVGLSALLFLAIPRFQFENSMFIERLVSRKARSGFAETIQLGQVSEIQLDSSVALSVDVADQARIPAMPYWRMLVLDDYAAGVFRQSPALRGQFRGERSAAFLPGASPRETEETEIWTFYLEAGVSRYLPLTGPFGGLRFRETVTFRHAPGPSLVALRDEPVAMMAYRVEAPGHGPLLLDPDFAARWAAREPGVSRGTPLYTRLALREPDREALRKAAADITGGATLAAPEFARRAGEWLRRRHAYSLSPSIPRGDVDPVVGWLVSDGAGHCELFAGSLVLLARSMGLPARVVTGFRGGSWNAYSNNFTVRNSEAHAWAEIFDESAGGWRRADPLQPDVAAQGAGAAGPAAAMARVDRSWTARLDSLRVFWYRRIVSFDDRAQAEALRTMKEAARDSSRWLVDRLSAWADSARRWLSGPWDARRWGAGVGTLGAAVFIGWILVTGRWRWRAGGVRRPDPVRREAGRWMAALRRAAGGEVSSWRVAADLERLRFGAPATWPDPGRTFTEARRAVRAARRARPVTPRT
jgi:hypothetical protein